MFDLVLNTHLVLKGLKINPKVNQNFKQIIKTSRQIAVLILENKGMQYNQKRATKFSKWAQL